MKIYLVGKRQNTWSFERAYEAAVDGDTIEFDEDYMYENTYFVIDKSLNFVGKITDINGSPGFSNTIFSKIIVRARATVRFSNLWFKIDAQNNNIYIHDHSKVEFDGVCFENSDATNTFSVIYVENGSEIAARNIWTYETKNPVFHFVNSKAKIINSGLNVRFSIESDSTVELENVTLRNDGQVLALYGSTLHVKASQIICGSSNVSAIWASRSSIRMSDSDVRQPGVENAIYLTDNSSLHSEKGDISSVTSDESRVVLDGTVIRELLVGLNKSMIVSLQEVQLLGENSEKIDIYLADHSSFIADQLYFTRVMDPNVRVVGNSLLKVNGILGETIYYNADETSRFLFGAQEEMVEENTEEFFAEDRETPEMPRTPETPKISDAPVSKQDSFAKLDQLVGLESVKREINKMIGMVDFNNMRVSQGLEPEKMSLHSVFMGNPGTGKTTVARLIGQILFESGALPGKEFIFVEATESDLISSNVGGTAEQTQAILNKARGGILFIDEAYTLNKGDSSVNFGQEAINTILKYMEDHREEIMIIFAGYTKEMEQFLKTNPGLESRVPNKFIFEDYTGDQIVEMGKSYLDSRKYTLEEEEYYCRKVKKAYAMSLDKSNARWIRNFNESVIKALANRVFTERSGDVTTIRNCDIEEVLNIGKYNDANGTDVDWLEELDRMIGIPSVKEKVRQFISMAELNKKREDQGFASTGFTLHSMFLGNPGTGKTTVARIVGNILYQKGIIRQKKFVEVSRSNLIGRYIGQTALKTQEVLESALGGVLFIDEAYSLSSNDDRDFGHECVDEILKFMEDHRQDMVIIFAGYTREMGEFLQMNSGLTSRVPNTFDFEDYTADEIVEIGLLGLKKGGYVVDEDKYAFVVKNCYAVSNDRSNGRWIRNFNEELIRHMSTRVTRENSEDLSTVMEEDLKKML